MGERIQETLPDEVKKHVDQYFLITVIFSANGFVSKTTYESLEQLTSEGIIWVIKDIRKRMKVNDIRQIFITKIEVTVQKKQKSGGGLPAQKR